MGSTNNSARLVAALAGRLRGSRQTTDKPRETLKIVQMNFGHGIASESKTDAAARASFMTLEESGLA